MTRCMPILLCSLMAGADLAATETGRGSKDTHPIEEIKGFGRNVEEAKRDARVHVLETLQKRMLAHDPPLIAWEPALADVDRWIQGPGRAGRLMEVLEGEVRTQEWILPVRFPSEEELVFRDRQVQRIWLTWQAFWGVMGVLALWAMADSIRRSWHYRRRARR